MSKVRKHLSAVVALAVGTTLFIAGCGQQAKKNDQQTPSPTVIETKKEPTVIKFAHWSISQQELYQKMIEDFEAKNPDIKIELEMLSSGKADEFQQKYDMLLVSGDTTDIIPTKSISDHIARAKNGVFEPLNDFLAKDGINIKQDYLFDPSFNGTTYGIPGRADGFFVLLNKKHLDEANLPVPNYDWTWEDYREYAKKLTKGEGKDKRYGSMNPTWGDPVHTYLAVTSTKLDNPLFKDENTHNLGDIVLKDFMKFKFEMENVDKVQVPYFEVKAQKLDYKSMFFNEKISMLPIGTFILGDIKNVEKYPHDFVTTFAPQPRWKDSPAGRERGDGTIYSINKQSKNKEAAYKFLKYFTQEGCILVGDMPAYKKADIKEVIAKITAGGEKYYDIEALTNVLGNKDRQFNVSTIVPAQHSQIKDILLEESEKYFVGGQSLDATVDNMVKRADEVMAKK